MPRDDAPGLRGFEATISDGNVCKRRLRQDIAGESRLAFLKMIGIGFPERQVLPYQEVDIQVYDSGAVIRDYQVDIAAGRISHKDVTGQNAPRLCIACRLLRGTCSTGEQRKRKCNDGQGSLKASR